MSTENNSSFPVAPFSPYTKRYVCYYRVSTSSQAKSGLGLDAQRVTVEKFAGTSSIIAEFTEIESGKKSDRVELHNAIKHAKDSGATLLIAKLDRLSRNVKFIFELKETGVDFVCCDLPDCNTLTLGIFAAFAQHERERISQRTKDGLAAAKIRGTRLGKPSNLTPEARAKGVSSRIQNARTNDANRQAAEMIRMYTKDGLSVRAIARNLNTLGMRTRRGKLFTPIQVQRLTRLGL